MKNKIKIIIGIVTSAVALCCTSCDKMNDMHQEYLDRGEITYATRLDSVESFSGRNRVNLKMYVPPTRVAGIKIYWGVGYADSLEVDMNLVKNGIVEQIISGLPEGSSFFKLKTFDKYGNYSLPEEITGDTYGELYESELRNNVVESIMFEEEKLSIKWMRVLSQAESMELTYTSTEGKEVTRTLDVAPEMVLEDYQQGSAIRFRTVFRPTDTCIDVFYSKYNEYTPTIE